MEAGRSWSIDSYLNEHFDIPAKNPPSEARLRWRRAVGLVRNRRRRFGMFTPLHALDDSQRRKILVSARHPFTTHSPSFLRLPLLRVAAGTRHGSGGAAQLVELLPYVAFVELFIN